jgi:multiple antibiotic resistance protein
VDPITFFIYAFVSVFVIVNPIGCLITFLSLTSGVDEKERVRIARRSVTIACILAVVFAVSGELILRVFGITVDCLRVAGGILLFKVAMDMLYAQVSRESLTTEEVRDASEKQDVSVFPIAMPLLTGPGAITTVVVLIRTGKGIELKMLSIGAILITFLLTYLIFRFANRIHRVLGVTGSLVISRVMGLLLAAIAVNFISVGAWNIYKSLVG